VTIGGNARLVDDGSRGQQPIERQLRSLIRYAILAPSTRNSQPWRFTIERNIIRLWADPARRLPVADPSRRELHLSLGCALENLLIAADCSGFRHEVACFPEDSVPDLAAVITLLPGTHAWAAAPRVASLEALSRRHTPHRPFLARPVASRVLDCLRALPGEPGVRWCLSDGVEDRRTVGVLSVRAVATLFGDAAYREEMMRPIGGNAPGLVSRSEKLTRSHSEPARRLARELSAVIRSASVIGLIGSLNDGPADQLRSGRVLERLWLAATMEGLALQPIGYPLQTPATREALAALFPAAGVHAQQFFRLGYATPQDDDQTPRRPVDEVVSPDEHRGAAHAP
jgi:nitroreductase